MDRARRDAKSCVSIPSCNNLSCEWQSHISLHGIEKSYSQILQIYATLRLYMNVIYVNWRNLRIMFFLPQKNRSQPLAEPDIQLSVHRKINAQKRAARRAAWRVSWAATAADLHQWQVSQVFVGHTIPGRPQGRDVNPRPVLAKEDKDKDAAFGLHIHRSDGAQFDGYRR